jgi:hypothetical protein
MWTYTKVVFAKKCIIGESRCGPDGCYPSIYNNRVLPESSLSALLLFPPIIIRHPEGGAVVGAGAAPVKEPGGRHVGVAEPLRGHRVASWLRPPTSCAHELHHGHCWCGPTHAPSHIPLAQLPQHLVPGGQQGEGGGGPPVPPPPLPPPETASITALIHPGIQSLQKPYNAPSSAVQQTAQGMPPSGPAAAPARQEAVHTATPPAMTPAHIGASRYQ